MADPLSVSSAVLGILSSSIAIGNVLHKTITSVAEAPRRACELQAEVRLHAIMFRRLDQLLHTDANTGGSQLLLERGGFIGIEDFEDVLVESVATFNELEALVHGLDGGMDGIKGVVGRAKWAFKESDIMRLIERLARQRGVLGVLLGVFVRYCTFSNSFNPATQTVNVNSYMQREYTPSPDGSRKIPKTCCYGKLV